MKVWQVSASIHEDAAILQRAEGDDPTILAFPACLNHSSLCLQVHLGDATPSRQKLLCNPDFETMLALRQTLRLADRVASLRAETMHYYLARHIARSAAHIGRHHT